jgi:DDB1- and CUL4-associated factor 6
MLGRDLDNESGRPPGKKPKVDTRDDSEMSAATRCVRRFAPNGKRRMNTHDQGHITACKISDANPNEMIASW